MDNSEAREKLEDAQNDLIVAISNETERMRNNCRLYYSFGAKEKEECADLIEKLTTSLKNLVVAKNNMFL